MANKSFDDVQVFFKFQDILDDKTGDLRKKSDKSTTVDLLSNLDPGGQTNTAIELAKIYTWFTTMIKYTPPASGETEGSIEIKPDVIPDSVKGVTEGYYDPESDKFYEDEDHTKEIDPEPGRIYVDKETDTPYRYDDDEEEFTPLDHDTKYSFQEGTTDGAFQYKEDDGSWTDVKIHNVPTLGSDGKIPANQLPSFVDDVVEGYFKSPDFFSDADKKNKINPETGKIYVDLTTNKTYRWSGSIYVEISESLALGETDSTAYRGDRGKEAYEHSQKHGTGQVSDKNPHGLAPADIGLGNIDNTRDSEKEVKSAETLKTARNIDGVDFDGSKDIKHYGECTTVAATVEKTVACEGFKLVTGAWIAVKFSATNSGAVASLTLNVNDTGAKPIRYRNNNLPSVGTLAANRTYMFVYDGSVYQLIGDLDTDVDQKVRQTLKSDNVDYPLLLSYANKDNQTTNVDNVSYRNNAIYANPSTGAVTANKFVANTFETTEGKEPVFEDNILVLHCTNNPTLLS